MTDCRRPNILWISFEDTYPHYGCYGDPLAKTPTLDRLAAEGCRWSRAFSTAGVCAPARSAVITGMYPISIGTHHMRTTHTQPATPEMPTPYSAVIPHYVKCFPEYLRAAGYYCSNNVKTDYQFDPPFTAWDELSSEAHWRNRPDPAQPFFAVFNPTRTHESGMWEKDDDENETYVVRPQDIDLPPYLPDTAKVRRSMARMYSNITWCDSYMAKLLGQLEEDGLAENTIVFHWSDHGPAPRGKRWPYDAGIRVPMIVRWPGKITPGTVCNDLVSTIDLAPTVLSLAGLQIPKHMQGQPFIGPESRTPRPLVYATRDRYDEAYDMVRAVRDTRFKYIRNCKPELPYLLWIPYRNRHPIVEEMWRLHRENKLEGAQKVMFQYPRPVEELYDTEADPHEVNNLAGKAEYRETLEHLSDALDAWLAEVGDMGRIPESEMVRQWYPDGERPVTAKPVFIPICDHSPGRETVTAGGTFSGPVLLQLHTPTQGASMGYTCARGDHAVWHLYTTPIRLPQGTTTVRAKAVRIGYLESPESIAEFRVD